MIAFSDIAADSQALILPIFLKRNNPTSPTEYYNFNS